MTTGGLAMSDQNLTGPPAAGHAGEPLPEHVREQAEEFFRANLHLALAMLLGIGAPYEVARDAVQSAGLGMLRQWERIHSPRAYLFQAAKLNYFKHRRDARNLDYLDDVDRTMPAAGDPATDSIWADRQWVLSLLNSLPPGQREVLALAVDQFTPAEMASALGRSPAAVRQSLLAARRRLARRLPRQRRAALDDAAPAGAGEEGDQR